MPVSGPTGSLAEDRSHGGKPGSHVEIDQAPVNLGDRRAILPAQAGIDREVGQDTPVIGGVGVVDRFAEIFVRVAEGDGAGVGHADEEVGQVGAAGRYAVGWALGCGAGKSEDAARILLEEIVELLLAQIAADGEVVTAVIDAGGSGKAIGAVTIERALLRR